MNTASNKTPNNALEAEVRARVPQWMKEGVEALAKPRLLDGADIVREAVAEYLQRHSKTSHVEQADERKAAA